jgi:hypothetical protein
MQREGGREGGRERDPDPDPDSDPDPDPDTHTSRHTDTHTHVPHKLHGIGRGSYGRLTGAKVLRFWFGALKRETSWGQGLLGNWTAPTRDRAR